ncbi:uncharacterized protein CBL_09874 [Carabus blaptoides fortunei]
MFRIKVRLRPFSHFQMYDWVDSSIHSAIPPNAVWCSKDTDNSDVYIGRASYDNAMFLAKIVPRRREAYIAYQGKEIPVASYKVLVNLAREQAVWVPGSNGFIPPNAIQCGYNKQGKKLFVGRTYHNGVHVPGDVHPFYKCIYVPFAGKEHQHNMYDWVDSSIHSAIPPNAVWCCKDTDNSDVYIGRASYDNAMFLAKIVPRRREAYIAYQGKEIPVTSYKVLVNLAREQAVWVSGSNGFIPPNAIQCGYNKQGKKLFVGRTYHRGVHVPGYVHPFYNCIFVPFGGQEHKYTNYEVLVNQI